MKYVKPERLTEQSLILDVRTPANLIPETLFMSIIWTAAKR